MSNNAVAPSPSHSPPIQQVRRRETAIAIRNGLKMGASLLVTWSVALIVKFQVPKHLGPIRQGHFGFAESFAAMFFATLGLGVDTYLAKEVAVRPKHASDVVGGVFALRFAMSAVLFAGMSVVLWATGRPREVLLAVLVFGAINLLTAINGTLGVVLNTTPRVGSAAVSNITGKIVWGAGLLIALHFDAPLAVLAVPGLLGEVLRIAVMLPATRREAELRMRIDVAAVRHALVESAPFFVNSLALGILGSLGMSVLEFIRHDEREVGWFAAVQNLGYLCVLLMPLIGWVVMPLLSRAYARSEEEGVFVFRRALEALVVAIVPVTVLISAGSDLLIHLAFGEKYAPAHTGLSILSLVFIMTYINTMLAMMLIIMSRGWSVTFISISAVFVTATLMLVFVPVGRRLLGEGGECAGASTAVITSEACVLVAMLSRFRQFPLDGRNVRALAKSVGLGLAILFVDRQLRAAGFAGDFHGGPTAGGHSPVLVHFARLAIDGLLYLGGALAFGVVRPREVRSAFETLRGRGAPSEPPPAVPAVAVEE